MIENGHVVGIKVSDSNDRLQHGGRKLGYDGVILAVGHSARDIYEMLLSHNFHLVPKDFAVSMEYFFPIMFFIHDHIMAALLLEMYISTSYQHIIANGMRHIME